MNANHALGYLVIDERQLSIAEAEALAASLGLVLVTPQQSELINDSFKLFYRDGLWRAQLANGKANTKTKTTNKTYVAIDFTDSKMRSRIKPGNLAGEYVVRAVLGRKKAAQTLTVVDATAGFGQDAFLLAAAGCQVTMIEQLPLLEFLLRQALAIDTQGNSEVREVLTRLQLQSGNSIDVMRNWQQARPDIVYLDPMYAQPEMGAAGLKKSAAVKKNMAFLQLLSAGYAHQHGEADLYGNGMLTVALTLALRKVIVKRAPNADWLDNIKPASSITGKAARFDIYPV